MNFHNERVVRHLFRVIRDSHDHGDYSKQGVPIRGNVRRRAYEVG